MWSKRNLTAFTQIRLSSPRLKINRRQSAQIYSTTGTKLMTKRKMRNKRSQKNRKRRSLFQRVNFNLTTSNIKN